MIHRHTMPISMPNPTASRSHRMILSLATSSLALALCLGLGLGLALPVHAGADTPGTDLFPDDVPHYVIERTSTKITIDGRLEEGEPWSLAAPIHDFQFPWWKAGEREPTTARMLWDEDYLYVAFVATDAHISAHLTGRDVPVSRDDAVEVFFACDPADVSVYFNFEFNALGTILDRSPDDNRSGKWNSEGVKVGITIDGTLNDSTDTDSGWTTEIAIPFADLAPYAPRLPPTHGDHWRLNLYRIGGDVNPQFSLWSNTRTERPQYHVPTRFGVVRFSDRLAGSTSTSP